MTDDTGQLQAENDQLRAQLTAQNDELRAKLAESTAATAGATGHTDDDVRRIEHPEEFTDAADKSAGDPAAAGVDQSAPSEGDAARPSAPLAAAPTSASEGTGGIANVPTTALVDVAATPAPADTPEPAADYAGALAKLDQVAADLRRWLFGGSVR